MLGEIERKLTAIVGDALASRTHLKAAESPGAAPDPGKGLVAVSVNALTGPAVFEREQSAIAMGAPAVSATLRRILRVQFTARLAFSMRPRDDTPSSVTAARGLILDDISLSAHALAAGGVRDGSAFQTANPDPGFELLDFALQKGTMPGELTGGLFTGELLYDSAANIWPPSVTESGGKIAAVDPIIAVLPLDARTDLPAVRTGSGTRVRVRSLSGKRLVDANTGARAPLRLAVTVVSDLPFGQRGVIASGNPGVETGFKIIPAADPETVIDYTAPTGSLGATRVEFVAIHMAMPDGHSGAFLGSVAVPLVQA